MSEMRCGVERGETEAEAPPPPAQPQFTCGVQLRRKRESCGPGGNIPPRKKWNISHVSSHSRPIRRLTEAADGQGA